MVCNAYSRFRGCILLIELNMKLKHIFTVLAAAAIFTGCSKEEIKTYNDLTPDRFIQFSTSSADVSFFRFPGETEIQYPVVVKSSGFGNVDMPYSISVVADSTTAASSDYVMPTSFTFLKGNVVDTFYVSLKYSDKLDANKMRLTLKIEENENFKYGESGYLMYDLWFHNNLVKPDWWTSSVTSYYLGTFSELKYKYFLQVTKVDLDGADNSTIRHYALIFKAWLEEQAAAGNPILEANGTPMTVPAGGK